jgi:YHS domain-containing protein
LLEKDFVASHWTARPAATGWARSQAGNSPYDGFVSKKIQEIDMLKSRVLVGLLAGLSMLVGTGFMVAEDVKLDGIKCFMMPTKDVKADKMVAYKDANVYFCCPGCVKKFSGDPEKFAAKANHQLVATKQFEQKACPFSGGDVNAETAVEIKGAKVAFCCNNCKGTAEQMEGDEQVEALFGEKAFEKAKFTKVESK